MEKFIHDLFDPSILAIALDDYGISPQDAAILDGFESFIYNVSRDGQDFILRIGHDSRRNANLVHGEAEFLNHLASGGLSVPRVLPSRNGKLVEPIPAADGSHFVAALFEKAQGKHVTRAQWTPRLSQDMGAFMGRLHQLSRQFHPSQARYARMDIEEDFQQVRSFALKYLPPGDEPILQAYDELIAELRTLPKDEACYGLCHIDFHAGNFFLDDQGKITLFDFDDSQYAWYVYDIAMALFYVISHDCTTPEALAQAQSFLSDFWAGYRTQYDLDPVWLLEIPKFLRLRELDLYIIIYRSFDINDLDPWCASFMKDRREKILSGVPYCDIDYRY